jgi:hypothetical protein
MLSIANQCPSPQPGSPRVNDEENVHQREQAFHGWAGPPSVVKPVLVGKTGLLHKKVTQFPISPEIGSFSPISVFRVHIFPANRCLLSLSFDTFF